MLSRERVVSPILGEILARLEDAESVPAGEGDRPFVTLAYAQSLDGSIAGARNRTLGLSCPLSLQLTHELRAAHDGILVGIGTVLADDPRLNVRHVGGRDPTPIVVDSRLRIPRRARLLEVGRHAWLATTDVAGDREQALLEARGAEVLRLPSLANGWVDLEALMPCLAGRGLSHVLVEGGARILTSFLKARLVDYVVITLSPRFVGGVPALDGTELSPFPRLASWQSERVGDDLVLAGEMRWPGA